MSKENEQKDKHELRNITQFKMNLTKNRGWSQVLWKGKHMFLHIDVHNHLASVVRLFVTV